jgi:hypothetical protein
VVTCRRDLDHPYKIQRTKLKKNGSIRPHRWISNGRARFARWKITFLGRLPYRFVIFLKFSMEFIGAMGIRASPTAALYFGAANGAATAL